MVERLGNRPARSRAHRTRLSRNWFSCRSRSKSSRRPSSSIRRFPRVHYYLGLTYLYKDGAARIPDAIEEFKIELAANPDEFFANFYLGILYIMERKWEPAIASA